MNPPDFRTASMRKLSRKKLLIFVFLAVALAGLVVEGFLSFVWLGVEIKSQYRLDTSQDSDIFLKAFTFDPELGWVAAKNISLPDYYGRERNLSVGAQGARGTRIYANPKPSDVYRILCVGDSFVFGHGVDDADAFPAQLESLNPKLESVNLGVTGYSTGQAWLMAERGVKEFAPDLTLSALIWDDLRRMRTGILGFENQVPKFKLTEDGFETYGIPLPEPPPRDGTRTISGLEVARIISRSSATGRTLKLALPERQFGPHNVTDNTLDEMLEVACLMYADQNTKAKANDRAFALVLLPTITDIMVEFDRNTYSRIAERLQTVANTEGFPLLDMREKFLAHSEEEWRNFYLDPRMDTNEHLGAAGNQYVAQEIHNWLLSAVPRYAEKLAQVPEGNGDTSAVIENP